MTLSILFILLLFFLIGIFALTSINAAIRRLQKKEAKRQFDLLGNRFFYRPFHALFFKAQEFEGIVFTIICGQNLTRFGYAMTIFLLFFAIDLFHSPLFDTHFFIVTLPFLILANISAFFIGEFVPRILGTRYPEQAIRIMGPIASLFIYFAFPISFLFLKLFKTYSHTVYFDYLNAPQAKVKEELIDLIQNVDFGPSLDPVDKKLIESVVTFRHRIAREIMVPRVNLFCLSKDTTVKVAAELLDREGYSRVPVYENTIDNMIGVLMYKDLLKAFLLAEKTPQGTPVLDGSIEKYIKSVLYTPETKKISHLLQEFRKKQVHLAIVVDEYGGTEGIVTIEDILEEIVGEIADEYDEEAGLFKALHDGSWIVDSRMSILDVDEELGIKIPQEGDFDTVGGYIYHRAGSIPPKGFTIHSDEFRLEVLSSTEKSVDKVKITPIAKPQNDEI